MYLDLALSTIAIAFSASFVARFKFLATRGVLSGDPDGEPAKEYARFLTAEFICDTGALPAKRSLMRENEIIVYIMHL